MKKNLLLGCLLALSVTAYAQNPFGSQNYEPQTTQPKMASASAFTGTYVRNYMPPASSGIIWVVISPVFMDYQNYAAKFTVTWGGYSKTITLPSKSGEHPFVVGFTHWDNNQYNFNVTMKPSGWTDASRAQVISIDQGAQPNYPYATVLRCGVNLTC